MMLECTHQNQYLVMNNKMFLSMSDIAIYELVSYSEAEIGGHFHWEKLLVLEN